MGAKAETEAKAAGSLSAMVRAPWPGVGVGGGGQGYREWSGKRGAPQRSRRTLNVPPMECPLTLRHADAGSLNSASRSAGSSLVTYVCML